LNLVRQLRQHSQRRVNDRATVRSSRSRHDRLPWAVDHVVLAVPFCAPLPRKIEAVNSSATRRSSARTRGGDGGTRDAKHRQSVPIRTIRARAGTAPLGSLGLGRLHISPAILGASARCAVESSESKKAPVHSGVTSLRVHPSEARRAKHRRGLARQRGSRSIQIADGTSTGHPRIRADTSFPMTIGRPHLHAASAQERGQLACRVPGSFISRASNSTIRARRGERQNAWLT
jgi:hypothetical protein